MPRQRPPSAEDMRKRTESVAAQVLVGRRVVEARYMTEEERNEFGWFTSPLVLRLDDGSFLVPQQDAEGNGGGVLCMIPQPSGDAKDVVFGTF